MGLPPRDERPASPRTDYAACALAMPRAPDYKRPPSSEARVHLLVQSPFPRVGQVVNQKLETITSNVPRSAEKSNATASAGSHALMNSDRSLPSPLPRSNTREGRLGSHSRSAASPFDR